MRNCWSSRLSKAVYFLLISFHGWSQQPTAHSLGIFEKGDWLFPIDPGKTAMLTGTMGELRNTHFHGGLDINTPIVGMNVRAAADGYILRATVSTSGYGNCLQVRHPNGLITLYAHLQEFQGNIAGHVREERYKRKTSELDLTFEPGRFPVQKGDIIALSGNSGSSGGPHLHFELRASDGEAINPMTANFDEVQDHTSPVVQKIALRTLSPDARINDEFGRFEFHVIRQGDRYSFPAPILARGRIGLEVLAYDRQENSRFKFGINKIEFSANGVPTFIQKIDTIRFSENRNILALMDYPTLERHGIRFNRLFVEDGNRLPYYRGSQSIHGVVIENKRMDIEIRLTDFHGNTSTVEFTLQPGSNSNSTPFMAPAKKPIALEVFDNIAKITTLRCVSSDSSLIAFIKDHPSEIPSEYKSSQACVTLVDLRQVAPDSIKSCGNTLKTNWVDRVPSGTNYTYFSDRMEVQFDERSLYDTLLLAMEYGKPQGNDSFVIGNEETPLFSSIRVTYRPSQAQQIDRYSGVYRQEGNSFSYLGNTWKNGRFQFSTLSFGKFVILRDTIPPVVQPVVLNGAVARLRIKDNLSGIAYFEASSNGRWLLMNYDYKTGTLVSERLDKSLPLNGTFELKVVDNAGNEKLFRQTIK